MNRKYNKPPKTPHIKLVISTWAKDSHGLYDYLATPEHYIKEKYYLQNECRIYRNAHSINLLMVLSTSIELNPNNQKIVDENIHIANLIFNRHKDSLFRLLPPTKQPHLNISNADLPFLVITKDYQNNDGNSGFSLCIEYSNLAPGNIIKLGRAEYMVIELQNNHQRLIHRNTNHFQSTNGTILAQKGTMVGNQCKICWSDEETQENPLFNPCNCKGTCAVIHVDCLRQWINSKVKKQLLGIAISYNFTKFQCEICKSLFPKSVVIHNTEIPMMTIDKPDKPYIILQSLFSYMEGREQRSLHLIIGDQDQIIRVGRAHTSDIRVTDISVSRNHAEIVFVDNQFLLRDVGSKFGTLVKFDRQMDILNDKGVKIQMGRTLLDFQTSGEPIQVDTE